MSELDKLKTKVFLGLKRKPIQIFTLEDIQAMEQKTNDEYENSENEMIIEQLIEKYNGIAIGDVEKKKIYLTFDLGYEAGYTEKILDVLKSNDVKACFFITVIKYLI